MTLLSFVRDNADRAVAAVIVDGDAVEYVFPNEPWFDNPDERTQDLLDTADPKPADEPELFQLVTSHLGENFSVDYPMDDLSLKDTKEVAQKELERFAESLKQRVPIDVRAESAYHEVARDYPDFAESLEDMSPEAMTNFVLMALGPIDPEGENGWILRAIDGTPREGDENEYVHFSDEVESESTEEDN